MSGGPSDPGDERRTPGPYDGPIDPRDFTRRTLLANERTYLAWWRTGLTTLTVALGAARVVPELSGSEVQWPYTVIGVVFGLLGIVCIAYAEKRRVDVDRAVRRGDFVDTDPRLTLTLTVVGVLVGVALMVVMIWSP